MSSERQWNRLALALLAVAMCASATWLMLVGKDLTFSGDEIFYYARFIDRNGLVSPGSGFEYFFAPHNGHLVVIGKLIYRGLFLTVGTNYTVFRASEIVAVFACVGLFFVLARRHIGSMAALIPSVLLLFLGYAGEALLWPFSLHTVLALALGLAALLTLDRGDRWGDVATCTLLVLAIATVEVGLAFTVGVAVSINLGKDRWRRCWIFAIPLVLFGIWWLWAQRFGQSTVDPTNVHLIPADFIDALSAVMGSVFGLNPTGAGVPSYLTTVTTAGTVLAIAAIAGLVLRLRRGNVPRGLWASLAVILTYWLMVTLAGRPPDSARYIFVGSLVVLLIAAQAAEGTRWRSHLMLGAVCVVVLAIPPNIAKLYDARAPSIVDARNTRTEDAMLELARHRVRPGYVPASDRRVSEAGGSVFIPLSAADYLRAAHEFGSLAFPLDEVRTKSLETRQIADASLIGALRIRLDSAPKPPNSRNCPSSLGGKPDHTVFFSLPSGGALLGSRSSRPIKVSIGRFGTGGPGLSLGQLRPRRWARLEVPPDSARDHWWAVVDGPMYVCSPSSRQKN